MRFLKRKAHQLMRRAGYVLASNVEDANAIAKDLMSERDLLKVENEALGQQLLDMQRECNEAVRVRDGARQDARVARSHAAAVTRAMGKVRTAMAQVFESVKEMEHWLAKHSEEISADLDADMTLGEDLDLGDHHNRPGELDRPQARYIGEE